MFESLDELRKKPEHVRRTIAVGAAVAISLLVLFVWMSIPGGGFLPSDQGEKSASQTTTTTSPLQALKNIFTQGISSLQNEIPPPPEGFETIFEDIYAEPVSDAGTTSPGYQGNEFLYDENMQATGTLPYATSSPPSSSAILP